MLFLYLWWVRRAVPCDDVCSCKQVWAKDPNFRSIWSLSPYTFSLLCQDSSTFPPLLLLFSFALQLSILMSRWSVLSTMWRRRRRSGLWLLSAEPHFTHNKSHYLDRNQAISVPSVRRAVHCVEDVCKKGLGVAFPTCVLYYPCHVL